MSSRASGGALAACLILAAIVGFTAGGYVASQAAPSNGSGSTPSPDPAATPVAGEPTPSNGLTIALGQTSATAEVLIPISGTMTPPRPGAEVKVQRQYEGGAWEDFPNADSPLTFTIREDGTFRGTVAPQRTGRNALRVVRVDDADVVSNEVAVTIQG